MGPSNFLDTELIREKGSTLTQGFNKPHKFSLHWSVKITISAVLLLENFREQNELRPILIQNNGELEKNIEMLVFHQLSITKLSVILKKETEATFILE